MYCCFSTIYHGMQRESQGVRECQLKLLTTRFVLQVVCQAHDFNHDSRALSLALTALVKLSCSQLGSFLLMTIVVRCIGDGQLDGQKQSRQYLTNIRELGFGFGFVNTRRQKIRKTKLKSTQKTQTRFFLNYLSYFLFLKQ